MLFPYLGRPTDVVQRLKRLYAQIQECRKCELAGMEVNAFKPYIKLGEEPILIISQNPSVHRAEFPYVYGALDKLLRHLPSERAVELERILDKIYVTNIIKCSTPDNRAPKKKEVANCLRWLDEEVKIINPKKIIVLGTPARKAVEGRYKIPMEFLEHPIAAIRNGRAMEYSYEIERVITDA